MRCERYNEACAAEINKALSSLTTAMPREGPTQPLTNSQNNITEQTVGVSSLLGVGVVTALLTAALMVTIIGWITTCVYYQQKDKIQ